MYIYTYIHNTYCIVGPVSALGELESGPVDPECLLAYVNLRTNIMDFRGFDSSIILILRGGILMSIEDFPKSLSQTILVGIMLVGRLGVHGPHSPDDRISLRSVLTRLFLAEEKN